MNIPFILKLFRFIRVRGYKVYFFSQFQNELDIENPQYLSGFQVIAKIIFYFIFGAWFYMSIDKNNTPPY